MSLTHWQQEPTLFLILNESIVNESIFQFFRASYGTLKALVNKGRKALAEYPLPLLP